MTQLSNAMERLVGETMDSLAARGIDPAELESLLKLRDTIRALPGVTEPATAKPASPTAQVPAGLDQVEEKRCATTIASEALLARASAVMDVLVQSGHAPDHAAQLLTRQLLGVGIVLPQTGGDARAWKRLFNWRENLIHRKRSGTAWDAYCAFKRELAGIPADERLRRVVGERIWDLRTTQRTDRNSA